MQVLKLTLLRLLRAAHAGEPTVLTPTRRAAYRDALSRNLLVPAGQRRGSIVNHLTEEGAAELRILEKEVGWMQPNYAVKAAVRRATGDRDGVQPGDLPPGIEL